MHNVTKSLAEHADKLDADTKHEVEAALAAAASVSSSTGGDYYLVDCRCSELKVLFRFGCGL